MSIQIAGSITLTIGDIGDTKDIILTGTVGNKIQVGFRARDGDPEFVLGTFETIIASVAVALGAEGFDDRFKAQLDELEKIQVLGPVVNNLRNMALIITDMALSADYDEDKGEYVVTDAAFGFRVEFADLSIGPVTLAGFGVLFEYSPSDEVEQLIPRPVNA